MQTRRIGSLEVTTVGMGCTNFGRRMDFDSTVRVVDAALDVGINFFDTADIYGDGRSEQYLGRALRGRRHRVLIASKFGKPFEGRGGARPEYVREAVHGSLKRLGTDWLDLYQLHLPDPEVPIAETLGALDELVTEGTVREIGCSNFAVAQLREAAHAARGARFASVQNQYSLLHREPERGVLEECRRQGMAFLPYFPLASGLLSGKYRRDRPAPESTRITNPGRYQVLLTAENLDAVERLAGFAESRGHTLLELAFSWLLAHDVVASVIAGATRPDQVRTNVGSTAWVLGPGELAEIDRLVAGVSVDANGAMQ